MVWQVAARGLMSAGARMLGSKGAKSAGGQLLKTGKIKVGVEGKALKYLAQSNISLASTNKILRTLEKASPAFMQQMIILRKSLFLMLRPIGDIMAKFLRPMACWMMKFAVRWYQLFGTGGAEKESRSALEDRQKQLAVELETARAAEDTDRIKEIEAEILKNIQLLAAIRGLPGETAWDKYEKKWDPSGEHPELVPNQPLVDIPALIRDSWDSELNWTENIWKLIKEGWNTEFNWVSKFWSRITDDWDTEFSWTDNIWKLLKAGWDTELSWTSKIWNLFIPGWDTELSWTDNIWKLLKDGWDTELSWTSKIWKLYKDGWDTEFDWCGKIWGMLKSGLDSVVSKIKNWSPLGRSSNDDNDNDDDDEVSSFFAKGIRTGKSSGYSGDFAVGGDIDKTGLYELHAGEQVIRAGEVSNSSQANSSQANSTFNNYITINANVADDLDIQNLARKLAEFQEIELRRRCSYI